MKMIRRIALSLGVAGLASAPLPALAQSYAVTWFTVDGGGTSLASGGSYSLAGTAGQADAGAALSGASYALAGGFWGGVQTVLPALTIASATLSEGNSGTSSLGLGVTLSFASQDPVSVSYATANGTALAGSDYVSASGTLSLAAGATSGTIAVSVKGDTLNEADETFAVNLSSAINATLATAQGQGTILNDDPLPALMVNDVTVGEGNSGTTSAVFTAALSSPSGQTVLVNYATAEGTASPMSDYTPVNGTLTFLPGTLAQPFSVSVSGDTAPEADETFLVNLSFPANATIAKPTGTATIGDDDGGVAGPRVFVYDRDVGEGGATGASFRIDVSPASSQNVTVNYTTADGSATEGSDYTARSGALTFSPGRNAHSVVVPILTDTTAEGAESFYFNITSVTGATLRDGQAVGTISDPPASADVPMYRAYNPNAVYHFFTTSQGEFLFAVAAGYRDESNPPCCSIPFKVPNVQGTGKAAIYRMYNPTNGRHYYTASAGERDVLMGVGWVYEKDEGFIYAASGTPGTVEVFKLYNSNSGVHLYTVKPEEKDAILATFPGIWFQHTSLGFAVP